MSCLSLNNEVPMAILTGIMQDVSIFLQFYWYQHVYYKASETSFPSESPEEIGHFVGFAENVGNALMYRVLTDSEKVISRSSLRSAEDETSLNRQNFTELACQGSR